MGPHRRPRPARTPPRPAAPRTHRLRLPGVQPDARHDRRPERRTPRPDGRPPPRPRRRPRGPRPGRTGRPRTPAPRPTLRRPTATRRHRPRPRHPPRVLFADEPTGALDRATGTQILRLLRDGVDQDGGTCVMVTHDPAAAAYADRVLLLTDGRLVDELHHPTARQVAEALARTGGSDGSDGSGGSSGSGSSVDQGSGTGGAER
ncbi:hypothetical protein KCH_75770 [Kitasatospora cheerisanensis KCTC 2395]|uniref:ABC transporter ATP-binding protein n=1 Tax=Kitasatospora cheerisanensis KCTC 2395 TaxID=1348663 RepID=A0A066YL51_9ACTN|nr:hypothetical protein KCH_75770 [Kitasatospora cheerisanensis KCTC 2395]